MIFPNELFHRGNILGSKSLADYLGRFLYSYSDPISYLCLVPVVGLHLSQVVMYVAPEKAAETTDTTAGDLVALN